MRYAMLKPAGTPCTAALSFGGSGLTVRRSPWATSLTLATVAARDSVVGAIVEAPVLGGRGWERGIDRR